MMKSARIFLIPLLVAALAPASAWSEDLGQPRRKPGRTWRVVGAVAGGVGGLVVAGAILDEDLHSGSTLAAGIFGLPAAGAIGGYLIGRSVDRRKAWRQPQPMDPQEKETVRDRLVREESARLLRSLQTAKDSRADDHTP